MNRRQLQLLGMILLFGAVLPVSRPATRAHAAGLSGQWNVLSVLDCRPNPLNAPLCNAVLGGWVTRQINSFTANCDANGVCSFISATIFYANQRGAGPCTLTPSVPFQGSCAFVFSGKAHIAQNQFHLPGFIEDSATGTASGLPGVTLPGQAGFDPGIPALPGVYPTTSLNLQLLGVLPPNATAPPGISFTAVIQQDTSATSPKPVALALPLPMDTSGPGASASFVVGWFSKAVGQGNVEFGAGPGCSGLVETGTQDQVANQSAHVVIVTGNDLPGVVGDTGIMPGSTYQFQTVTASRAGQEVDNNGGKCYGVSIPRA